MSKKLLMPLPGAVCAQYVTCGKPNCRCKRGIKHGAYWYRFWREGGRLRKQYIKASDLEGIRRACLARQTEKKQRRESMDLIRQMRAMLRENGL